MLKTVDVQKMGSTLSTVVTRSPPALQGAARGSVHWGSLSLLRLASMSTET